MAWLLVHFEVKVSIIPMAQFGEFVVNHWLLVLALVVILVLIIAGEAQRKLLGFTDIKPQEAVRLMNQEDAIALMCAMTLNTGKAM